MLTIDAGGQTKIAVRFNRQFIARVQIDRLCEDSPRISYVSCARDFENEDAALLFHERSEGFTRERVTVVGDVRLADRSELTGKLGLRPVDTPSDLCLITHAWERWGCDCTRHFVGEFAFLLWDDFRRELFAARDPLGVKPFFYAVDGSTLLAASALHDLLAWHPHPPSLDEQALTIFLSRPFQVEHFTSLRRQIESLAPGHYLHITPRAWTTRRYCDLGESPEVRFPRPEDYREAFLTLLRQAVQDAADTPERVGVHLSGGLDSSSIAVLAAQTQAERQVYAYCWQPLPQPGELESEDQRLVRMVADQARLSLRSEVSQADDLAQHLALDPFSYSVTSTLALECAVQRAAQRDGVRVMLSGWGGDEAATCPGHAAGNYPGWRVFSVNGLRSLAGRMHGSWDKETKADTYLSRRHLKQYPLPPPIGKPHSSVRDEQIHRLTRGHLAERMSSWAWAGARQGIEYRYPMLDLRLVRFVLGLPPELYERETISRQFPRQALTPILPGPVVSYRDKRDLTRTKSSLEAIAGALGRALARLRSAKPERVQFVEIKRLESDMKRFIATQKGPSGLLLRTVAFLNPGGLS